MGMTIEELRDYVDQQRNLNNIPYHVYSALIDGIDTLEQEPTDKKFTKADIDAIIKAINKGWELRVNEVLDKIRAEIEQLPTNYIEVQRPHSTVERHVVELDSVLRIFDKYKAESEDKE